MSTINKHGSKVILKLGDPIAAHWHNILTTYNCEIPLRRRQLAMLCLHQQGWNLVQIADVFGLHKGAVCRQLRTITSHLRRRSVLANRTDPCPT